jgi:decaprenyl-phosphate phosphoribosyltransferase
LGISWGLAMDDTSRSATTIGQVLPAAAQRPALRARSLLAAMRPLQYAKNLIVFAPAMFAERFDAGTLLRSGAAFLCFCAVSSATYLVNDSMDAPADRLHPVKRSRPIASGAVPVRVALAAAAALAASGLLAGFAVRVELGLALAGYLVLQAAYNLRLKREPILDVMCVALGFVVRALGAGAATGIVLSGWFLLCVALLALYLAIEKRKAELSASGTSARAVLRAYTLPWLTRMESVVAATALMSYSLWAAQRTADHMMLATVPVVAYVLFRYQMISETRSTEAPEVVMLRSPHIVGAACLWAALSVSILLLHQHGAHLPVCASEC